MGACGLHVPWLQVVVVESKLQAETVLERVQELVRQKKLIEVWNFHDAYVKLCSQVDKTPPLPGLKKEFSLVLAFPGREDEPFALVSAFSIATHVKGMFARPLYSAICLRAYHERTVRIIRLLRSITTDRPVLAPYEDSYLKKQHDKYVYDKETLDELATPDPDEVAAMRNACRKGGMKASALNPRLLSLFRSHHLSVVSPSIPDCWCVSCACRPRRP